LNLQVALSVLGTVRGNINLNIPNLNIDGCLIMMEIKKKGLIVFMNHGSEKTL